MGPRASRFFLKQGTGIGVVRWCNGREPDQRVVVLTTIRRRPHMRSRMQAQFDKSTELEDFFEYCSAETPPGPYLAPVA